MSATIDPPPAAPRLSPTVRPRRSPYAKTAMMWFRRLHLYFGLFLFPWACLYGVTAFLFNHPQAFSEAKTGSFGKEDVRGTPMEDAPDAEALARQVFAALEKRKPSGADWTLHKPQDAGWAREFAFATAKGDDGGQVSVLFDMWNGGGTVREAPAAAKPAEEKAPFAVGSPPPRRRGGGGMGAPPGERKPGDPLALDRPLPERLRAAAAKLLERRGVQATDVAVTSVPALEFAITADGRPWKAVYDPMTGSVSGTPEDAPEENALSVRSFLLRLHLSHGYPSSWGARWFWAVVVDAMAFVMCFWGVSGLLMWWQIKATRRAGWLTLAVSAVAAVALGVGMHAALAG